MRVDEVGEVAFVGYPFWAIWYDEDEKKWGCYYPATIEVLKFGKKYSCGWYKGLAPHYSPIEYDWLGENWVKELLANYGEEKE